MIKWTDEERDFANHNGDQAMNDIIDGFNAIKYDPLKMIDFLLEMPKGWACPRWEGMPCNRYGQALKTIRDAITKGGVS